MRAAGNSGGHNSRVLIELEGCFPLILQAVTNSYERLEFLGDAVLGLSVRVLLMQRYPKTAEVRRCFVKPSCACMLAAG